MADKVYEPEVIKETPFPSDEGVDVVASSLSGSASAQGVYTPRTIKASGIPRKVVARETMSSALNTKTRKILGEFEFTEQGSIKIGNFVSGISGDIRLTPNGITARDSAGIDSFALDGTTGNATFRGVVQASDFQVVGGGIIGVATEGLRHMGGFASVQDAINWLEEYGGGTVYLPQGTYDVDSNIAICSNVSLIGESRDLVIFDFKGGSARIDIVGTASEDKKNIRISGIKFQKRRVPAGAVNYLMFIKYADSITIEDCEFYDNWDSGTSGGADIVLSTNAKEVHIKDNKFTSSGNNIHLANSSTVGSVNIISNKFYDSNSYCIRFEDTSRVKISLNTFDSCKSRIITTAEGTNKFITFSDNCIYNHLSTALSLGESGGSTFELFSITGNIFEGGTGADDVIHGEIDNISGDGCRRGSITGNVMQGFTDGIDFVGAVHVTMTGNVIRDMSDWGCDLGLLTSSNILIGNTFFNNTGGDYRDQSANNIVDNTGNYNVT